MTLPPPPSPTLENGEGYWHCAKNQDVFYYWDDINIGRFQVETAGLSYLKYADALHRGLIKILGPNAPNKRPMARNFKELSQQSHLKSVQPSQPQIKTT